MRNKDIKMRDNMINMRSRYSKVELRSKVIDARNNVIVMRYNNIINYIYAFTRRKSTCVLWESNPQPANARLYHLSYGNYV